MAPLQWTLWTDTWDQQSLVNSFSNMVLNTLQEVTNWVCDSGVSNHTTLDAGNISSFRSPNTMCPSFIIVGNGSILPVTSVVDSVLPGPFYLNSILHTLHIIDNLLSVRRFTTNNLCSMEFDHLVFL
jgi:hypothetical protein